MLTRALTTLTLLLTFAPGADRARPAAVHPERARVARHAPVDDDIGGCREPAPSPIPVAPAACADEGQP
ncbi:MAG TPA: hypothetical protein VKQ32_15525 [Polyangia bacterium]|nr:hypothetical protein [Polyangia bacterium]